MKSSICIVLALVASSPASTVVARGNGNRRHHNRIRNLHNTRDLVTGAMPPQAPEGYSERQLVDQKDGKTKDGKTKTTTTPTTKVLDDDKKGDLKDKKDKKDQKDQKDKKDMKKMDEKKLDDKKKTDPKLLEKKEEDVLKKDPKNEALAGGEDGLGGLFTGGRVDEEDGAASAQTANANGGKKGNPAKIVAPLVVVGGVAALAGYKFFGNKSGPEVETEGDRDVPVAKAVADEKATVAATAVSEEKA